LFPGPGDFLNDDLIDLMGEGINRSAHGADQSSGAPPYTSGSMRRRMVRKASLARYAPILRLVFWVSSRLIMENMARARLSAVFKTMLPTKPSHMTTST